MMRTRSLISTAAVTAASVLLAAGPAFAGNGHFIASATSASASGPTLTVKFKEAGLESGAVVTITAYAHLDATYQCVNGGGKNPNDPKKTTVSADVSNSDTFTAPKNGNITGSLTLTAPAAASVLDCPNGQKATLSIVTWSDISIADTTSPPDGDTLDIPGTFSSGELVK
jgi:hypothetical protein